jgi:branched-chain amino acid transport system substrate-binding protein
MSAANAPRLARLILLLAAAIAMRPALGLAACEEPIRIGLTDPLTGPFANFGKDQLQASEWAVDDINAKGGVDGCKLEIVAQDHQGKPEVGIAVANRFIDVDHLPLFYGGFSAVVKANAARH